MRSFLCLFFSLFMLFLSAADPITLAIGSKAPDFKLKGVDGKKYNLKKFKKANILVVVFTCNHCPTAQAYEDRLIKISNDYKSKGVQVVAISPNDPKAVRLDELGYTDLNDGFEDMKVRDADKKFPYPYLYDGDNQNAAKAYGAVATPHVFIFDKNRILRYQGRIDDVENPKKKPSVHNVRIVLEELIANKEVAVPTTKVFGCSVKWASKKSWLEDAKTKWAEEPVAINKISENETKHLLHNHGNKLRVINVWATWCGPCVTEFPDLMDINKMYRGRDFEMITLSADNPKDKEKALTFLKKNFASTINYIFENDDKYKLIEALDPAWQGALPYTIVIEPNGKVIYRKQGVIDPLELKRVIVDSPTLGRFFK